MTNGVATGTNTGVLSPYGSFVAMQPGPAALVTMPDPDTGEQGTCVVYSVSLQLDKNHDGIMDSTVSGPDVSSPTSPMELWINNDYDFTSGSADPYGHDVQSQFNANYQDPSIRCPRDLEDWFRLWICGVPVLTNGYHVSLSWANITTGSPAINLVNAVETNGGTSYLTDTNTAIAQCADPDGGPGQKYNTITVSNSLTLPSNLFTNIGNKYFLFEGAGIGTGELRMSIYDDDGKVLCQSSVFLDIHDAEDFIESAVLTDDTSGAISNWTSGVESVQRAVISGLGPGYKSYCSSSRNPTFRLGTHLVIVKLFISVFTGQDFKDKFFTVKWPW